MSARIEGYFTDKAIDLIIAAILAPILTALIERWLISRTFDLVNLFLVAAFVVGISAAVIVFLSGHEKQAYRGQILTHELTRLIVTEKDSKVTVSRDYVFLEKPQSIGDFIEAEDDKVKALGPNGLQYESEDSKVQKFAPLGPNRYALYWKPHHEIVPYSVYRHKYEYKPLGNFVQGVRYLFVTSNFPTGHQELEVETFKPFAQVECFATRRHFKDAEELAETVLFLPNDLTILKQNIDTENNRVRISIPNPYIGMNYYIAWSHDGSFGKIWRDYVEGDVKKTESSMKVWSLLERFVHSVWLQSKTAVPATDEFFARVLATFADF